jgi:hypothetical protein
MTGLRPGKLASLLSVEVICPQSKAPRPSLKPLHRHELTHLAASRDAFGLLVGMPLDISPVGCDDDEPRVPAVIREPLPTVAGFSGSAEQCSLWSMRSSCWGDRA